MTKELDEKKLLGMLGLAARARKLIIGTELVTETIRKQTKKPASHRKSKIDGIVIIADDAADNTTKRIVNCCEHYGVKYYRVPIEKMTLAHAIGKLADTAVCGVFEKGFIAALGPILENDKDRTATTTMEERVAEKESFSAEGIEL